MQNIILTFLCCLSVFLNGVIYFKSADKIKHLEETIKYLEIAVETMAAVQAMPEDKAKPVVLETPSLSASSSSDLERRIQSLEYDNQLQQNKIKNLEFENDYTQHKLYMDSLEQEKLNNRR